MLRRDQDDALDLTPGCSGGRAATIAATPSRYARRLRDDGRGSPKRRRLPMTPSPWSVPGERFRPRVTSTTPSLVVD